MSAEIKFSSFNFQLLQWKSDEATTLVVPRGWGNHPQPQLTAAGRWRREDAGENWAAPPAAQAGGQAVPTAPTEQRLNASAHPTNLLCLHHLQDILSVCLYSITANGPSCTSGCSACPSWSVATTSAVFGTSSPPLLQGQFWKAGDIHSAQSTHFIPKFLKQSCLRQSLPHATSSHVEAKLYNNCH